MVHSMLTSLVSCSFIEPHRKDPLVYQVDPSSKLMLNLKLCTHLDLLFPMIADCIEKSQVCQKATHDSKSHKCTFALGQAVYAKNFREGEKRIPGHIVEIKGSVTLTLNWKMVDTVEDTRIMLDHVCQISHMSSQVSTQIPASVFPVQLLQGMILHSLPL